MNARNGFTLIELLIVVTIIGIIVGIALPNYLNAQVRARVSQAQAEMRTLATALEVYYVDRNSYPHWMIDGLQINPTSARLVPLTTPVAYLSSIPGRDPFPDQDMPDTYDTYDYVDAESFAARGDAEPSYRVRGAEWRLSSAGPDRVNTYGGPVELTSWENPGFDYDPSNGTVSKGDIVLVGPKSRYAGNYLYPDKVY